MTKKQCSKKYFYLFIISITLSVLFLTPNSANAEKVKSWSRGLALGINMARGDSDSSLVIMNLLAEKQSGKIKVWRLGLDGSYGKTNKEKSSENALAFLEYRHSVTNNLYWSAAGSAFVDTIATVDYRFVIGPAMGFFLIKDIQSQLSFEIGPTYTREKIKNEQAENYASARLAERYERVLNATVKVWQSIKYLPDLRDCDNFFLNAELGTETALNPSLSLRITARNKYDNEPADNKKKNNSVLIISLNYNF